MGFGDILKGTAWVAGKLLQGSAYIVSYGIEEMTGVDIYGTVKDSIEASKSEKDFREITDEAIQRNSEGAARKRVELMRNFMRKMPDQALIRFDYSRIRTYEELEVYKNELRRRRMERTDSEFQDFENEMYASRYSRNYDYSDDDIDFNFED